MHTLLTPQNLQTRLHTLGWKNRVADYTERLAQAATLASDTHVAQPMLSVIVVSHAPTQYSLEAFLALKAQVDENAELIFVDNGSEGRWGKLMGASATTFVRLYSNAGAYLSRNMGSVFARGKILVFVDDDALVAPNFLHAYRELFAQYKPLCARGRVEPLTDALPNSLARHYDLGSRVIPRYPDLEGNMAVDAQAFFQVGGWDDALLYGHGGMDLSFRLLQLDGDRGRQLYSPAPCIRHDYAQDSRSLHEKRVKQQQAWAHLCAKHTGFNNYATEWENWHMRGGQPSLPQLTPVTPAAESETHVSAPSSPTLSKTIYLHIGLPKTGTTSIQRTLDDMTALLEEQNYAYVTCEQCFQWLLMLLEAREKGYTATDSISAMIRSHIAALPQKHIVLSCENFSGYFFYEQKLLSHLIAQMLGVALQGHDVHVLVYLRRQDRFFESIYTQTLHIGRDWSFEEYMRRSSPELLRWKEMLGAYAEVFGRKALEVRIYDRKNLHNQDAVSDFLQWAGIRSDSLHQEQPRQENLSFSPEAVRIARAFNSAITMTDEERAAYPLMTAVALKSGTKSESEYLHCRQACRHGIHPERYRDLNMSSIQRVLGYGSVRGHAAQAGYMDKAQRVTFLEQYAEENAAIARQYLGKEDGILFDDSMPHDIVQVSEPSGTDITRIILPLLIQMHTQLEQQRTHIEGLEARLASTVGLTTELQARADILAHMTQWIVSGHRKHSAEIATIHESLVEAAELLNKVVDAIAPQ